MTRLLISRIVCLLLIISPMTAWAEEKPNIILIMADDLGWADVGFNGNKIIKTPHLDQMAKEGLVMKRFYAASAVCSPTRASCLTGRSPYRTGVFYANTGILRPEEITLPEILRTQGYLNGHFGKWHLGTLTTKQKDANRARPGNFKLFNPPSLHGYDTCFVTESKVPTYDPVKEPIQYRKGESRNLGWKPIKKGQPFKHYGTHFWDIKGNLVQNNLEGDASKVVMDRVLPFIENAVEKNKPFLSVIWFHAPHLPCVAGPKYQKMYEKYPLQMRNYAGCITAMDEQIGRLRARLKTLGVAENTMIWFCSDNGPEGNAKSPGRATPFRGRKRDLREGGIRVPGLLVWPSKIKKPRITHQPCVTYDYLPTILDILKIKHPKENYQIDGVSLLPLIQGHPIKRGDFYQMIKQKFAAQSQQYKLISFDGGKTMALYDIVKDQRETTDLAKAKPQIVKHMKQRFDHWYNNVEDSFQGKEYGKKSYKRLRQKWQGAKEYAKSKKKQPRKNRTTINKVTR